MLEFLIVCTIIDIIFCCTIKLKLVDCVVLDFAVGWIYSCIRVVVVCLV